MIKIVPIPAKGKDLRRFIDFPHDLNEGDPNYVPELFMAQRDLLNPAKHPFFLHSEMQLFLAYKDGKIVGRIAAILNNNNNTFNNSRDGFFGFFDCINDQDIAGSLLDVAKAWLIGKGMKTLIGPVNPSTNEACGLLVEGFDTPPKIMMPYNKAYYSTLLENYGLKKKVDLLAHALYKEDVGDKPVRLYDALVERLKGKGIIIRKIDLGKRFKEELASFGNVYNAAWDKNMGFVPLTKEEFEFMGKDLKLIADPDYCLVAEHDGKIVGVSLCLPDINQVLIKVKRGRLFPTGIFKLLLGKGKVNALRVMALGVLEPYRKMGIEACFYAGIMKKGIEKGIVMAEASWILEHNDMMNRALEHINSKVYKKYRIYEMNI